MFETSAFYSFHGGNSTFINSFDQTKFLFSLSRQRSTTVSLETKNPLSTAYSVILLVSLRPGCLHMVILSQLWIPWKWCINEFRGKCPIQQDWEEPKEYNNVDYIPRPLEETNIVLWKL